MVHRTSVSPSPLPTQTKGSRTGCGETKASRGVEVSPWPLHFPFHVPTTVDAFLKALGVRLRRVSGKSRGIPAHSLLMPQEGAKLDATESRASSPSKRSNHCTGSRSALSPETRSLTKSPQDLGTARAPVISEGNSNSVPNYQEECSFRIDK